MKTLYKGSTYRKQLLTFFIVFQMLLSQLCSSTTYVSCIWDDKNDLSPLVSAIKAEDSNEVRSLLAEGADVNEIFDSVYTPLMAAAYVGNLDILDQLLSEGAIIERYDNCGNNALMFAFYGYNDRNDITARLLELNVKIDMMNQQQMTPVILCSLNGHAKSLARLIDAGAHLEIKGMNGNTALMDAVSNGRINTVELLINHGADIEVRDDYTMTLLMEAAFNDNGQMVRLLLDKGIDPSVATTKKVSIKVKKDIYDYWGKTVDIPIGSTALDIARQFDSHYAEHILVYP